MEKQSQDTLYDEAVKLVTKEGKITTSFIQRHLQVGYNRSVRIIESLEQNGIVSAIDTVGKRTVLAKHSEKVICTAVSEDNEEESPKDVGGVQGQRLVSFIERVERLEEEKTALIEDIKEVYAEAKGVGFDVKAIRKLVSLRKMDAEKRNEMDAILELYKSAVGMV